MEPSTAPAVIGPGADLDLFDRYDVDVRPLRTGKRLDVTVRESTPTPALDAPDFVARLRQFFAEMDAEITRHEHDPIATAQALARIDALLADVRFVRDRLNTVTAASLDAMHIRRLTVESVATVEASASYDRSEWQHARLLTDMLEVLGFRQGIVSPHTGEVWEVASLVEVLLSWFRPEWKITAVRAAVLDPDDYCTVKRDDDGKPVKTPAVRIVDNRVRRQR